MATIKLAEEAYMTLHGRYATLGQLLAEQYLRTPSRYFAGLRLGAPPGGYTLVGAPGECGNLPVAGPS
jgi:hypothetical protein